MGEEVAAADYSRFKLGDWKLQSGEVLPKAWIAYKTFGDPGAEGGVILYPTWYSGSELILFFLSLSFSAGLRSVDCIVSEA